LARSDLRPGSILIKRQALRYFTDWFGDLPVGEVNPAIAEDYRALLVAPKPSGRGLSKSGANAYLANLKPFWHWCHRHGRVQSDPFEQVKPFKLTKGPRETFSAAELGRLMMVADPMWQMRICIGLLGDRRGEMLATVVSDVHLNDREPEKSYILLSEKDATATTYTWGIKDHAKRFVALPQVMEFEGVTVELHRLVRQRIKDLPADQPYLFIEDDRARRAVAKKRDDPRDVAGNFQRSFRALQKRAQIAKLKRFHELRAAFATALIHRSGIEAAANALGHANIQTTRVYDRTTPMSLVVDAALMARNCFKTNVS